MRMKSRRKECDLLQRAMAAAVDRPAIGYTAPNGILRIFEEVNKLTSN
jgi:hypothetical protein